MSDMVSPRREGSRGKSNYGAGVASRGEGALVVVLACDTATLRYAAVALPGADVTGR